ncbi:hypothetical protein C5167_006527 [Papaver somniferum]|uniref:Uncharacterized protein n=1 Tax=Papaver somniferum TaxID=3469 RepID=A0A4Y7JHT9_PAPSO|nr:hypothetical protein C5167_006527 [Papaver somniferum]
MCLNFTSFKAVDGSKKRMVRDKFVPKVLKKENGYIVFFCRGGVKVAKPFENLNDRQEESLIQGIMVFEMEAVNY